MKSKRVIEIHSWGGFGSQLFAISTYLTLRKKFPNLNFQIIHHTGGVTERNYELPAQFPQPFKVVIENQNRSISDTSMSGVRFAFRKYLRVFFTQIRYVVYLNYVSDFKKISRLTKQIRGHYSYLNLNEKNLKEIFNLVAINSEIDKKQIKVSSATLLIHYRLGDLLEPTLLKQPQDNQAILKLINLGVRELHLKEIYVLSDSVEISKSLIPKFGNLRVECMNVDPISTILQGVKAKFFIGTNSKLSLWIALFRANPNFTGIRTFLPKGLESNFNLLKPDNFCDIEFY